MTNSERILISREGEKITLEIEANLRKERAREGLLQAGTEQRFWR